MTDVGGEPPKAAAGRDSEALDRWLAAGLVALARGFRDGRVRSVALTERALARAQALQSRHNAFISFSPERALSEAAAADAAFAEQRDLGPLHGAPYALKDLIDAAGAPTTDGARLRPRTPRRADAAVTARLRRGGAVLLGKTNLHELAYGVTSANPHFGVVGNPSAPGRSPGGSSGGSAAAVAAGVTPMAVGTDTGCSIRHPAHCCGLVGFKPSRGRVSAAGVTPLVRMLDHVGPITRDVASAALALDVMSGFDPAYAYAARSEPGACAAAVEGAPSRWRGGRIGRIRGAFAELGDAETLEIVSTAVDAAAAWLSLDVVDVRLPGVTRALRLSGRLFAGDPTRAYGELVRRRPSLFGPDVLEKIERGLHVDAADVADALHARAALKTGIAEMMRREGVRALIGPTCTAPAPALDDPDDPWIDHATLNCTPFNLTGQPSISIPCGRTAAGFPIGLMITGAPGDDAAVAGLAAAVEAALAEAKLWRA